MMHSNELAFLSSHGIKLNQTGGYAPTAPNVNPELKAAAVSATEAIIQTADGKSVIAPISQINPDSVELACDTTGCVLIADDGNPNNDVIVPGMETPTHYESHDHDHYEPTPASTHGIVLQQTGGYAPTAPNTNPELAAAAVSATEAIIQTADGKSVIAPISQINPDAVELACDDTGCVLIADDGNPNNDIIVPGMEGSSSHGIKLLEVGGNVQTAPNVNPELAAAAVSPTEAII